MRNSERCISSKSQHSRPVQTCIQSMEPMACTTNVAPEQNANQPLVSSEKFVRQLSTQAMVTRMLTLPQAYRDSTLHYEILRIHEIHAHSRTVDNEQDRTLGDDVAEANDATSFLPISDSQVRMEREHNNVRSRLQSEMARRRLDSSSKNGCDQEERI